MTETELFKTKIALVQAFLIEKGYDGILLSRADNFAMATGGRRNYVGVTSDFGASALFVTKDGGVHYIGNSIEEPRLMGEELAGLDCAGHRYLWTEGAPAGLAKKEFSGNLVSDDGSLGANVNGKLSFLRSLLTPAELEKYRHLGALAAEAIEATAHATQAGMSEADIAATLVAEGAKRRCVAPIFLIAADERIARYRHPLPTYAPLIEGGAMEERCVQGYVMIVAGFVREGLVASVTRFKQVGDLPDGIPDAFARICCVDALMQEATVPGKTLGDVFAACQEAYVDMGFPEDEWRRHHQGGATGYAGRTCKGAPGQTFPILDTVWSKRVKDVAGIDVEFGQAFAWNPSAVGVKSEDTFILLPDGTQEIVTRTPHFPKVDIEKVLGRTTPVVKSGIGT